MRFINPLAGLASFSVAAILVSCGDRHANESSDHDHSDHSSCSHDHGDHSNCNHGVEKGPNGGRILKNVSPKAEFLVDADQHITITFYDDQKSTITPEVESITANFVDISNLTTIDFKLNGDHYRSVASVADKNGQEITMVLKVNGDKKIVRFPLEVKKTSSGGNETGSSGVQSKNTHNDDGESHDHSTPARQDHAEGEHENKPHEHGANCDH